MLRVFSLSLRLTRSAKASRSSRSWSRSRSLRSHSSSESSSFLRDAGDFLHQEREVRHLYSSCCSPNLPVFKQLILTAHHHLWCPSHRNLCHRPLLCAAAGVSVSSVASPQRYVKADDAWSPELLLCQQPRHCHCPPAECRSGSFVERLKPTLQLPWLDVPVGPGVGPTRKLIKVIGHTIANKSHAGSPSFYSLEHVSPVPQQNKKGP